MFDTVWAVCDQALTLLLDQAWWLTPVLVGLVVLAGVLLVQPPCGCPLS